MHCPLFARDLSVRERSHPSSSKSFITNHGYLDNPTFRGMRQSLEKTFDEIYLMDLHGNSRKKEVAPDGSADKNVFDIQPGVAVAIMMKYPKERRNQDEMACCT